MSSGKPIPGRASRRVNRCEWVVNMGKHGFLRGHVGDGHDSPKPRRKSNNAAAVLCMVREKRALYTTCSNGFTCNAGGECIADELPARLTVISTSLPAQN
jgi:hypothetical protein